MAAVVNESTVNRNEEFRLLLSEEDGNSNNDVRIGMAEAGRVRARMSPKTTAAIMVVVGIPQLIAAVVVLSLYWEQSFQCELPLNYWVIISCFRMVVAIVVEIALYRNHVSLNGEVNEDTLRLRQWKAWADVCSIPLFLVGNVWIFSDGICSNACPPLHRLGLSMVLITYCLVFAPLILLLLAIPFCCFIPCFMVYSWYNGRGLLPRSASRPVGMERSVLNALPQKEYHEGMFPAEANGEESGAQCSICLGDYDVGVALRILPCEHHFHTECVDEWLVRNATCPNCRQSLISLPVEPDGSPGAFPSTADAQQQQQAHDQGNAADAQL